ncbi:MAG: HAD-IA family hydrolase [Pseudomonadota bacterium]
MSAPRCVIFDCDGVLIDSEGMVCALEAEALTRAGYPITGREVARRFAGVPGPLLYAEIEAETGLTLPPTLHQEVQEAAIAAYQRDLKPLPGAKTFLESLDRPFCVASSSAPAKLALGLVMTELYDLLYPNIFSASLVAKGKPFPDIFLYAAERMGADPADCLVIEDSVAGAKAAAAAGMRCVGFTGGGHIAPGHGEALRREGVIGVIDRLADADAFL